MQKKTFVALPTALMTLRVLIFLNWAYVAVLLVLLICSFASPSFLLRALQMASLAENPGILLGVRTIIGLGILCVPFNLALLRRLMAMVETVRAGDPFVAANADRLQAIAWIQLSLQLISITIGAVGSAVSTPGHPLHLDAGFSPSAWLAIVMTFVLARVFADGAAMRDDLEGTV
jgi:hypothetical protein